jgi:hypothetical protein
MKRYKLLIVLLSLNLILLSCSSFKEAGKVLRNEKTNTSDEFLVKKKEPLTQPPDFDKIPEPSSMKTSENTEEDSLRKILKASDNKNQNIKTNNSSTEKSILNKIKK